MAERFRFRSRRRATTGPLVSLQLPGHFVKAGGGSCEKGSSDALEGYVGRGGLFSGLDSRLVLACLSPYQESIACHQPSFQPTMHSLRALTRGRQQGACLLAACEQASLQWTVASASPLQQLLLLHTVRHASPADRLLLPVASRQEELRQFDSHQACAQSLKPPVDKESATERWVAAGWTRQAVVNLPNALSLGRALSGPLIGYLICNDQHATAFVLLAASGATDWADGYFAKRWKQSSVLGSYLDPLADKVLICCTVGALAYEGSLPTWLAVIVITRDAVLVGGAFIHRMHALGWKWRGWPEYFRMVPSAEDGIRAMPEERGAGASANPSSNAEKSREEPQGCASQTAVPVAPFVQPLYVSKVNTVFQLGLIGGCLTQSWFGFPPDEVLVGLGVGTGLLTVGSAGAYFRKFLRGELLPLVKRETGTPQ